MNILRARARIDEATSSYQIELIDLSIVAEGDSEDAMLRDLEHSITAEYHIAHHLGETPFVRIFNPECPDEVRESWEQDGKKFRTLNLTPEVKAALAAVFRSPSFEGFRPCTVGDNAA